MVTVECIIPRENHYTVWGSRDSKVQNIQRPLNVTIKFPDREKSEDADKVTMNGDAHVDDLEAEFQANFEAQREELIKTYENADLQDLRRKTEDVLLKMTDNLIELEILLPSK
ncbi:hypothetical protein NPIL_339401 [Nephila pilipes]|uniref:Uncharacterized protein n=1 Tax=Nephila pilipes TaxID=299642 RepID=A0A8X6U4G1_NEPPI|nr:hypothetical protein NPIL_339401 [Nephila pilipes]